MSNGNLKSLDSVFKTAAQIRTKPKSLNPQVLVSMVLDHKLMPRQQVAEIAGIQVSQLGKLLGAGGNTMSRKAALALADAVLEMR